jgi:hypothetical protein
MALHVAKYLANQAWAGKLRDLLVRLFTDFLQEILLAGSNVTVTYDEETGTFTFATAGGVSDGDKGDITVSSSGTVWEIDEEAILDVVAGKHAVPIMASSLHPRQTAGCAPLAYLSGASGQPDVPYLAFDSTSAEYAGLVIAMPSSWDEGTVTFVPHWTHPATTTDFGVVWKVRAVAVSNDDTTAVAFGTAQSSTDTGGTTSDAYAGPESSAITIAGSPAASDLVFLEIYRDPTEGSDTLAVDAYLIGLTLYVTTAAAVDA